MPTFAPHEVLVARRKSGGPGTGFTVLRSLPPGTRLRVLREEGGWRQVEPRGDRVPDGFVHGAHLRRIGR